MSLNKKTKTLIKKTIAWTVIFAICFQAAPFALSSGPSMPEVQKFEPVDAKDLVNLYTGDFNYTLPVINVPGSEGGYSLALSYKGGIQTDEEASWVGLGWNLQAGSVTRTVSDVPDDYRGGIVNYASPDFVSLQVGGGVGIPNTPFSLGVGIGWDSQSGLFGEIGMSAGAQGASVGITYRSYLYSDGGSGVTSGASLNALSSLGEGSTENSLESGGGGGGSPSVTAGVENSNSNPLLSLGVTIPIPPVFYVSAGASFREGDYNGLEYGYLYSDKYFLDRRSYGIDFLPTVDETNGDFSLLPITWDILGQAASFIPVPSVALPAYVGSNFINNWPAAMVKRDEPAMYGPAPSGAVQNTLEFLKLGISHATKLSAESGHTPEMINTSGVQSGDFPCWGKPGANLTLPSGCSSPDGRVIDKTVFNRFTTATKRKAGQRYMSKLQWQYMNQFQPKDVYTVNAQGLGGDMAPYHTTYSPASVPNSATRTLLHFWDPNFDVFDLARDQYFSDANLGGGGLTARQGVNAMKNIEFRFRGEAGGQFQESMNNILATELMGRSTPASQAYLSEASKKVEFDVVNKTSGALDPNTGLITGFHITKEDGVRYDFDESGAVYDNNIASLSQDAAPGDHDPMPLLTGFLTGVLSGAQDLVQPGLSNTDLKVADLASFNSGYLNWFNGLTSVLPSQVTDIIKFGTHEYFNRTFTKRFAYAWNLTGIRGSDFVDANNSGKPDAGDYGFWVGFKYRDWTKPIAGGQTSQSYRWATPVSGMTNAALYQSNKFDRIEGEDYGVSKNAYTSSTGSKTIKYLHSIRTNTHVAAFETEDRQDALGLGANLQVDGNSKLKRLKRIVLLPLSAWTDANSDGFVDAGEYLEADIIRSVNFNYDYSLCPGTPNSQAVGGGKLTLKSLTFGGKGGKVAVPAYRFAYGSPNPSYGEQKWDRWGMYKSDGAFGNHVKTNPNDVTAWSLTDIILPTGGQIKMEYESDRYSYVQNQQTKDGIAMNFRLPGREESDYLDPLFSPLASPLGLASTVISNLTDRPVKGDTRHVQLLWKDHKLVGARLPDQVANPWQVGDQFKLTFNTIIERHNGVFDEISEQIENGWAFLGDIIITQFCTLTWRSIITGGLFNIVAYISAKAVDFIVNLIDCILPTVHWHCKVRVWTPFGSACIFAVPSLEWDDCDFTQDHVCEILRDIFDKTKLRTKQINRVAEAIDEYSRYRVNFASSSVTITTVDGQFIFFGQGPDLYADVAKKYKIYKPSSYLHYATGSQGMEVMPEGSVPSDFENNVLGLQNQTEGNLFTVNEQLSHFNVAGTEKEAVIDREISAAERPTKVQFNGATQQNVDDLYQALDEAETNLYGQSSMEFDNAHIGAHDADENAKEPIGNMDDFLGAGISCLTTPDPDDCQQGVQFPANSDFITYDQMFPGGSTFFFRNGIDPATQFYDVDLSLGATNVAFEKTGAATERHGGGLRMKSLELDPAFGGTKVRTEYEYGTGVATSEPPPYGHVFLDNRVVKPEDGGLGYLPGATIGYDWVSVKRPDGSYIKHEFVTPKTKENEVIEGGSATKDFSYAYMGQVITDPNKKDPGFNENANSVYTKVDYRNPSLAYGQLIRRSSFAQGAASPVEETKNIYKFSNAPYTSTTGQSLSSLGDLSDKYYVAKTFFELGTYWDDHFNPSMWLFTYDYHQPRLQTMKTITTRDGVSQSIVNHRFDPLTGAPSLVSTQNSDFNSWEYQVPYYLSGQSLSNEFKNRNMLTQSGKSMVYQTDQFKTSMSDADLNDRQFLRSMNISSWASVATHSSLYDFNGNGQFDQGADLYERVNPNGTRVVSGDPANPGYLTFNSTINPDQKPQLRRATSFSWREKRDQNGVPLAAPPAFTGVATEKYVADDNSTYDEYGNVTESVTPNGSPTAMTYGFNRSQVEGMFRFAKRAWVAALTGEGLAAGQNLLDFANRWERGNGNDIGLSGPISDVSTVRAHTGKTSVRVVNAYGPTVNVHQATQMPSDFQVSAWVYPVSGSFKVTVEGRQSASIQTVNKVWSQAFAAGQYTPNKWQRVTLDVPIAEIKGTPPSLAASDLLRIYVGTHLAGGGEIYVDDVRCAPTAALVTTYTHDERGKMTSMSDNNDTPTFYEYDSQGRLIAVRDAKGSMFSAAAYRPGGKD